MASQWDMKKDPLYRPSSKEPHIVAVPPLNYLSLSGSGNPNTSAEFSQSVEALYALSYGLKMLPKKGPIPPGYIDYVVGPLQGLWTLLDPAAVGPLDKDNLAWTLLIRQPDFVNQTLFRDVREIVTAKKAGNPRISMVELRMIDEGSCCQYLHLGPFDDEPASFAMMEAFVAKHGRRRAGKDHHEIYLCDFRKTVPEKLKTILRFPLAPA